MEYLEHKENWTPILTYVHRTRLMAGFFLGTLFGLILGTIL